jgi:hypothetical protein
VVGRVVKLEIIFLMQWRVKVGRSRDGSLQWWCGFNASVSTREGRRRDKVLPKDEAVVVSSS